jgi:hypothetical protein
MQLVLRFFRKLSSERGQGSIELCDRLHKRCAAACTGLRALRKVWGVGSSHAMQEIIDADRELPWTALGFAGAAPANLLQCQNLPALREIESEVLDGAGFVDLLASPIARNLERLRWVMPRRATMFTDLAAILTAKALPHSISLELLQSFEAREISGWQLCFSLAAHREGLMLDARFHPKGATNVNAVAWLHHLLTALSRGSLVALTATMPARHLEKARASQADPRLLQKSAAALGVEFYELMIA